MNRLDYLWMFGKMPPFFSASPEYLWPALSDFRTFQREEPDFLSQVVLWRAPSTEDSQPVAIFRFAAKENKDGSIDLPSESLRLFYTQFSEPKLRGLGPANLDLPILREKLGSAPYTPSQAKEIFPALLAATAMSISLGVDSTGQVVHYRFGSVMCKRFDRKREDVDREKANAELAEAVRCLGDLRRDKRRVEVEV